MRNLAALCLTVMVSCSGSLPHLDETLSKSMMVMGRYGFGHACPVAGAIISAGHIVETRGSQGKAVPLYYTYQQGEKTGFLNPKWTIESRDLGGFSLANGDKPEYWELAYTVYEDQTVYWNEYDYRRDMRPAIRTSVVKSVQAGHFTVSPPPVKGASGSCVFNEGGQVVGIVVWGVKGTGVAASLVRPWWPMQKD